jgi:Holliday junction resolvase RusA-like endonuclease
MNIRLNLRALSVNEAFQGRRFKTKKHKQFEKDVSILLPKNIQTKKGYVNIHYRFYLQNWKKTDVDNLLKPLTDVLVRNGVIEDDRKIIKIIAEKIPYKTDCVVVDIISNDGVGQGKEQHFCKGVNEPP